jgi:hypothetical protein
MIIIYDSDIVGKRKQGRMRETEVQHAVGRSKRCNDNTSSKIQGGEELTEAVSQSAQ